MHRAHATTGDGLLAALLLCESLVRRGTGLADAVRMEKYPQVLVNVRTRERLVDPAADAADEIEAARARLADDGRVLVRASGTEPLVRVMVEARDRDTAEEIAGSIARVFTERHDGVVAG